MKNTLLTSLLVASCFFSLSYAAEVDKNSVFESQEDIKLATFGHIDAKGLKSLMDSVTPFILIDARGNNWRDPNKIPGALSASSETSEKEFEALIPSLNNLIIVYGFTFTCPKSTLLAKKLVEFGYINVIKYPGGLSEWRDEANYPVDSME